MTGFRKFLMRGNLIDLAVAVVIGVAFNAVVQALIRDMITPIISAFASKRNFSQLAFHVGKSTFSYGDFLNFALSFLITAAVVYYLLVAPTARVLARVERNKEATERECPECLSQIPVLARRCSQCTAEVPPAGQPASHPAGQYGTAQFPGSRYPDGQYAGGQYPAGSYGAGQYESGQYAAGQQGAGQYGAGQHGAGQHGAGQSDAGQQPVRTPHPGQHRAG